MEVLLLGRGVGSRGLLPFFRFEAEGADGDLGGIKKLGGLDGMDAAGDGAVGDAGNEVANVLVAGEFGHGGLVLLVGALLGVEVAALFVAAFLEREVAGVAAALNGGGALGWCGGGFGERSKG
jgi:hypothetical protein